MAAALTLLLIGCLLQDALSGEFQVTVPQTISALSGSCVTIPCSFDVQDKYYSNLDNTCKAVWKNDQHTVLFPSTDSQQSTIEGKFTGDLKIKDCTTTLNNMRPEHSNRYIFRVECDNVLKWDFMDHKVDISISDDPPTPTLSPSTLNVREGTSVSLSCSAPAPCLSHPPTLTWTPHLSDSQEILQENPDKTKVKTSVLNFTASHLHHEQKISCTAVYTKQDGSTESSESSLTADIQYSPKHTTVSVSPSGPVPEHNTVTLTCSSSANPAVNYTWYRADGDQETVIGTGQVLNIKASEISRPFFCKAENYLGEKRSNNTQIDVQNAPKNTTVSVSPSGPVPEHNTVTLTCSSSANPAVNYTWYRADGDQETVIGTGQVLNIQASEISRPFFCKAENYLGEKGSNNTQIDVQYSPKHTTVLVSPSGPVREDSDVTLTCSSSANPAVKNYTWYRADGDQETDIGTGQVLNIKASQISRPFFCKAENDLGAQRSNISQIDVQYSPKHTTVLVSPSGPVRENSDVTLTCSSSANPAVNYTWYRTDGGQETVIGTGQVLNIRTSKDSKPFFCKAENVLGAEQSNITLIDVQFAPQILSSSECTKAADQLNCSCETVGNPSPTMQWYLDGSPVNHSDKFVISSDSLNNTCVRDIVTVNQTQERSISTLLCRSSNSLGSADHRFYFYFFEIQTSAESQGHVMLTVFITTVVVLLVLVCALLLVIRAQRTRHNRPKSTLAMSQLPSSPERNEVPDTAEEDIYVNSNPQGRADVAPTTVISEPNNAEEASRSPEKMNAQGSDVLYASVTYKTKKKKAEDTVDMDQPGDSYLEEEICMVGSSRSFVSNALEMGNVYDNVGPSNVKKEVECEYAQVKFKNRKTIHK